MRIIRYRNSPPPAPPTDDEIKIVCADIVRTGCCRSERCIAEHIFGGQAIHESVKELLMIRKDYRMAEELVVGCTSAGSPFRKWLLTDVGRKTVVAYVAAALEVI